MLCILVDRRACVYYITHMLIDVRQTDIFAKWLASLKDVNAVVRINVRIRRLSLGNPGDAKSVGDGVSEMRIDYGPGYRSISSSAARAWSCCFAAATSERSARTSKPRSNWRRSIDDGA